MNSDDLPCCGRAACVYDIMIRPVARDYDKIHAFAQLSGRGGFLGRHICDSDSRAAEPNVVIDLPDACVISYYGVPRGGILSLTPLCLGNLAFPHSGSRCRLPKRS